MRLIKTLLPALALLAALLPTAASAAEPVQLSPDGIAASDAVAVVGDDGARTVAWLQRAGQGQATLVFSRLAENGTPGPAVPVAGGGNARSPVLVALPDGVVMALWEDGPAADRTLTAYISPDGSSEPGPVIPEDSHEDLDAVATPDGTTTVAWMQLIKIPGQKRLHLSPRFARISPAGDVSKSKWLTRNDDDVTELQLTTTPDNTVLAAWASVDEFLFDRTSDVYVRGIDAKGKLQKRAQRPFKKLKGSETLDSLDGKLLAATSARKDGSRTLLTGALGGSDGLGKFRAGSKLAVPTGTGVKEPSAAIAQGTDGGWLAWKDAGGVHVGPVDSRGAVDDLGTLTGIAGGWKSAVDIGPGGQPTVAYASRTAGPEAATLQPDVPEVVEQLLTGGNGTRVTPLVVAGPETPPAVVWETNEKQVFVATG
jgi:hypothetical protein